MQGDLAKDGRNLERTTAFDYRQLLTTFHELGFTSALPEPGSM